MFFFSVSFLDFNRKKKRHSVFFLKIGFSQLEVPLLNLTLHLYFGLIALTFLTHAKIGAVLQAMSVQSFV